MPDNDKIDKSNYTDFTENYVDVFKKWHTNGFCNVQYWPQAHRVVIDIGTTDKETLKSNAKCFVPAGQFVAYLSADIDGRLSQLYPDFFSKDARRAGAAWYGGTHEPEVISRVMKVTTWSETNTEARAFKCAWFKGTITKGGAVEPDYTQPLRNERIMMNRQNLAELYENLTVEIIASRTKLRVEGGHVG